MAPNKTGNGIDVLMLCPKKQNLIVAGLVVLGIVVRLVVFLYNRGFWQDEASLALNLVDLSYSELLGRLENAQVAPPLFLIISKFMGQLFGLSEYSLRLLPLLSGCFSLLIVAKLIRRLVPDPIGMFAIAVYSLGFSHIDYATNFKQYSTDELSAAIILLIGLSWDRLSNRSLYVTAALLPFLLWLSYTSAFLLSGLVLIACLSALRTKAAARIHAFAIMLASTITSMVSVYLAAARNSIGHGIMTQYWLAAGGFPGGEFGWWPVRNVVEVLGSSIGVTRGPAFALSVDPYNLIAASFVTFICILGAWRLSEGKTYRFGIISAALLLSALAASLIRGYPLVGGRLTSYFAPIAFAALAAGLESFHRIMERARAGRTAHFLAAILLCTTIFQLFASGGQLFVRQDVRDVAREIYKRGRPGIPILVDPPAHNIFRLYGGPLLSRKIVWLKNSEDRVKSLDSGWIEAGRPAEFWVIITNPKKDELNKFGVAISQYATLKDLITEGDSGAVLLEIRP
ncbi:MAG: glycosyltransferase family 39 protein [Candidatus Coatesbacteria bacterium]|nr:glycosyltransferase family 39 protein [Candidatus Coatesbacteria bacterium]